MGILILAVVTFLILHSLEASKYPFGSPEWHRAIRRDRKKTLILALIWLPFGIWGLIEFVALTIACFSLGGPYIVLYFVSIGIISFIFYLIWRFFIRSP